MTLSCLIYDSHDLLNILYIIVVITFNYPHLHLLFQTLNYNSLFSYIKYSKLCLIYTFTVHNIYIIIVWLPTYTPFVAFIIFRLLDFTILLYSYNWYYFTNSLFHILYYYHCFNNNFYMTLLKFYYLDLQWFILINYLFGFIYFLYQYS